VKKKERKEGRKQVFFLQKLVIRKQKISISGEKKTYHLANKKQRIEQRKRKAIK